MAKAMAAIECLLDTSVLIKIWRGDARLKAALELRNCGIETIACLEFLQGVNKRQTEKANEFIAHFEFIPFTSSISYRAINLIQDFSHDKGLRVADALIAATSLELDAALVTINKKHFEFIKGLKLI